MTMWLLRGTLGALVLLLFISGGRRLFLSYQRAARASREARQRLASLPAGPSGFLDVFADDRELAEAAEEVQKFPRGYPDPHQPLPRPLTTLRARSYAAAAADRADYLTYVGQLIVLFAGGIIGWTISMAAQDLAEVGFKSLLLLVGLVPAVLGVVLILRASSVWRPLAELYEAAGDRLEQIERQRMNPRKRHHRTLSMDPARASLDRAIRRRRQ